MSVLKNKTAVITGSTRGVGFETAKKLAQEGANVVILGKSLQPHPKLPGTIPEAVAEIEALGGRALGVQLDIRDEAMIQSAIAQTVEAFGGIDIVVNNASAVYLTTMEETESKRFDLMQQIIVRGSFLMIQHALPYLKKSSHAHVVNICPPIALDPKWIAPFPAYTMAKYSSSLMVMGLSETYRKEKIAFNGLWPRKLLNTEAVRFLLGEEALASCRDPKIMADAIHQIVIKDPEKHTGNFYIDDKLLASCGIDVAKYASMSDAHLINDAYVEEEELE